MSAPVHWTQITPDIASRLPEDVLKHDVVRPRTEEGNHCIWPWDPQQLLGAPLGMYHCPYCGDMQIAGLRHTDRTGEDDSP